MTDVRFVFAKFSSWSIPEYSRSEHPEYVAIRNIVSQHPQNDFILIGEGERFEHFKQNRISFFNMSSNTKIKFLFSFILKLELAILLRPSAIVAFGGVNIMPFGLSSVITGSKLCTVITGEIDYGMQDMPALLRGIFGFLLRITFRKSHAILTISQDIRTELARDFGIEPKRILVYRYRISGTFNPNVTKSLKSSLNANGPVALTLCRISPEKGLENLIEASRVVVKNAPNVVFVIKGSSRNKRYENRLRELVRRYNLEGHVKILPFSPYLEIPKYLSASDIFVLPSVSEGLPVVILEALASGIPVVASRVGGIPDILTDGCNALLVEPANVQALAKAILKLLRDDRLRESLREEGFETVRYVEENDIEKLLAKFVFTRNSA